MRRVLVVVTARPSYARIYTALEALHADSRCDLCVVAGASALLARFGRVVDQIRADGFHVAAECWSVVEGSTLHTSAKETGLLTSELASAFDRLQPDVVVTIADRHETIATAIAASYQHIPLVHVQGGERTGSIDDKVRNSVTMLADWHLVSTVEAVGRLMEFGIHPSHIACAGCPSIDLALRAKDDPWPVLTGVGSAIDLRDRGYLLIHQHPVTNEVDQAHEQMTTTLEACRGHRLPLIACWPGQDAGGDGAAKAIREFREVYPGVPLHVIRAMAPRAYLRLLSGAAVIVGNSSAGIREASALGTPAVNIGSRQVNRERGGQVFDVPHDAVMIRAAVASALAHGRFEPSTLYGDGQAGQKIAKALLSMELQAQREVAWVA